MKRTARSSAVRGFSTAAAALLLAGVTAAAAQPPSPGGGGEEIAFEVQSVDARSWVVTARDLETGELFSFRLPPESFRGQRFQADLGGGGPGEKITVQAPPGARLDKAVIQQPMAAGGPSARSSARGTGLDRGQPSAPGGRPGGVGGRSGPSRQLHPGRRAAGPIEYQVISVDSRNWQVEARGSDGSTVTLGVDPQAFVGYRFRAAVKNLRAGQGFELLATNDRPLENCCTVKGRPGR